jgi:hypothetical protein
MKKIISLFILTIGILVMFGQNSNAQEARRDNFENMTFEVELSKESYVLLEPVYVNFKFSNKTGTAQKADSPYFMQESKLLVTANGKTSVFEHLSSGGAIPAVRFPTVFKPGTFSSSAEIFGPAFAGAFFPEPGVYRVQFVLRSSDGGRTIASNSIDVEITEPAGLDKEALEFMRTNKEFFGMSTWVTGRDSEALLETFVNKYSNTVYGELAINSLGHVYLGKGDLEKASIEFEKIKNSRNPNLKKDAAASLVDIEKKGRELKSRQLQ